MPDQPAVAAFDVDGTLTRRDSFVPFLLRCGRWRLLRGLSAQPLRAMRALVSRDRDALKALAVDAVFRDRPFDVVVAAGERYADHLVQRCLRRDTLERLRWHQDRGHAVVQVSASLEVYLRPLATALGVDAVIGTRLAVGIDGRCTGALVGANCRGPEKVARLDAWLADTGRAEAVVWAYGDSPGDRDLLDRADHPTDVHRHGLTARGASR